MRGRFGGRTDGRRLLESHNRRNLVSGITIGVPESTAAETALKKRSAAHTRSRRLWRWDMAAVTMSERGTV